MNLFGRKRTTAEAPPPPSTPSAPAQPAGTLGAIAKLRDATETLDKREEHLLRKIDNEVKQAKQFSSAGKKREALTCIKRKKMYEKQLEQIDGARTTLEVQKLALENLNINKEVLDAQRAGAATMASVTAQMGGVDAVDDTMGQIEEGLADANEIADALSRPVAGGMEADEDDLLAELEQLQGGDLEAQALSTGLEDLGITAPSVPSSKPLPAAPTSAPVMTDEERELAELEASMAM